MPRFFFHVRDGGQLIRDPEGTELADLRPRLRRGEGTGSTG
jgi:hypothetical protein